MAGTRAAIKAALLAQIQSATFPNPVNGQSTWVMQDNPRRLKLFDVIDPSAQPCFFLVQHREGYLQSGVGTLARRYLDMGVWCYATANADSDIGDDMLDSMMEGIENCLVVDNPQRNEVTLGGLCYWCRIVREDNMFIRDPGDINGQALLIVPIRILIP